MLSFRPRAAASPWPIIADRKEAPRNTPRRGIAERRDPLGVKVMAKHAAKNLPDLVDGELLLPDDHRFPLTCYCGQQICWFTRRQKWPRRVRSILAAAAAHAILSGIAPRANRVLACPKENERIMSRYSAPGICNKNCPGSEYIPQIDTGHWLQKLRHYLSLANCRSLSGSGGGSTQEESGVRGRRAEGAATRWKVMPPTASFAKSPKTRIGVDDIRFPWTYPGIVECRVLGIRRSPARSDCHYDGFGVPAAPAAHARVAPPAPAMRHDACAPARTRPGSPRRPARAPGPRRTRPRPRPNVRRGPAVVRVAHGMSNPSARARRLGGQHRAPPRPRRAAPEGD